MVDLYDIAFGDCTVCRRCTMYCPFGIDMAIMVSTIRSILTSQGMAPKGLQEAIKNYQDSGNQMAISEEDWVETLQWMEEELQDELPGATIPIDKKGARIMYTVNAREPKFYPQDIQLAAKVFHVVGEDWTLPSKMGWDDTNLAMFAGDAKTAGHIVQLIYDRAVELGVQYGVITECGHAFRSVAFEGPVWLGKDYPFKVVHSVELFAQYIREGRLTFDRKITEPITYQDPCNVSRNGGLSDAARYIISHISPRISGKWNPTETIISAVPAAAGPSPWGLLLNGAAWKPARSRPTRSKPPGPRSSSAPAIIVMTRSMT